MSFLHVSKPEIDLPPGTDVYSPAVYSKGRENFQKLIAQGALQQDEQPGFYLYRQIMGQHAQVGLVAAASCEEYLKNIIKKHELTRLDKEDDRVRHIEALNSQTGPVFLTYRAVAEFDAFVAGKLPGAGGGFHRQGRRAPYVLDHFQRGRNQVRRKPVRADSVSVHRRWPPPQRGGGARCFKSRKGAGHSGQFLAVIFPHNQMQILPYNRVLKDLNGHSPEQLLQRLDEVFTLQPAGGPPALRGKHEFGFYFQGQWQTLRVQPQFTASSDPIERLDVTILQQQVLAPIFGIDDPRTSKRINFVGGIRGTAELEKLVNSGEYACAFSLFPTSIEDLMSIADAGGIMPPKSTWFEPKLRDAMFCHLI